MTANYKPVARTKDLVTQDMGKEFLVYDLERNQAYCLNETLAKVFKLSTGEYSVSEIARKLAKNLRIPVSENLVWFAIEEMGRSDLLVNAYDSNDISRREAIRRVGFSSALALPIIYSVSAPSAVQAQSVCSCANNLPAGSCAPSGAIVTFGCFPDQPSCVAAAIAASSPTAGCCNGVALTDFNTPTPGCCTVSCEP